MPDHRRSGRALFFRQRQEFDGKLAHHVAVERDNVCGPGAIESGKQQKWIFRSLSERLRPFNQKVGPLFSGPGFRRSVAANVEKRGY